MRHALHVVLLVLALSGCSTMAHGPLQTVPVTSDPPGARIYVDGARQAQTTPTALELHRKRPVTLRLEKPGYQPATVPLVRKTDPLYWANVAFPPALLLDYGNQSHYVLEPKAVHIDLQKER